MHRPTKKTNILLKLFNFFAIDNNDNIRNDNI